MSIPRQCKNCGASRWAVHGSGHRCEYCDSVVGSKVGRIDQMLRQMTGDDKKRRKYKSDIDPFFGEGTVPGITGFEYEDDEPESSKRRKPFDWLLELTL